MRKLIIIFFLFSCIVGHGQQYKQYFDVPNKNTRFRQVIPSGSVVFEKDSAMFYKLLHIALETDSMATMFRLNRVTEVGGGISTESDPVWVSDSSDYTTWRDTTNKIATQYYVNRIPQYWYWKKFPGGDFPINYLILSSSSTAYGIGVEKLVVLDESEFGKGAIFRDAIYAEHEIYTPNVRQSDTPPQWLFAMRDSTGGNIQKYPTSALMALATVVEDTTGYDELCEGLTIYSLADSTLWQHVKVYDSTGTVTGCQWQQPIVRNIWNRVDDRVALSEVTDRVGIGKHPETGYKLDVLGLSRFNNPGGYGIWAKGLIGTVGTGTSIGLLGMGSVAGVIGKASTSGAALYGEGSGSASGGFMASLRSTTNAAIEVTRTAGLTTGVPVPGFGGYQSMYLSDVNADTCVTYSESASTSFEGFRQSVVITDTTLNSEDTKLEWYLSQNGSLSKEMELTNDGVLTIGSSRATTLADSSGVFVTPYDLSSNPHGMMHYTNNTGFTRGFANTNVFYYLIAALTDVGTVGMAADDDTIGFTFTGTPGQLRISISFAHVGGNADFGEFEVFNYTDNAQVPTTTRWAQNNNSSIPCMTSLIALDVNASTGDRYFIRMSSALNRITQTLSRIVVYAEKVN